MAEGWTYELTFRGETFELTEAEQVAGRSRTCDISVPDASVSRRHVRLMPGPGHLLVQDLDSSNGTFINGRRIHGEDAAEDGDVLRLGDAELQVSIVNTSSYQTMRMSTATVAPPTAETPSGDQMRRPPGPATTMLAAESLRMAEQAELDRQAQEADEAGRSAAPIPEVPSTVPSTPPTPAAEGAPPAPPSQAAPVEAPPPPTRPQDAQPAEEVDSPLTTRRLSLPPLGPPADSPSEGQTREARSAQTRPAEPRQSREAPWAHAAGDSPSPHQTQRFDSRSFVAPPAHSWPDDPASETDAHTPAPAAPGPAAPEPRAPQLDRPPETLPEAPPADQPSPLQTQRLDSSSFVPPPPESRAQRAAEPESSPLETQRLEVQPPPSAPESAAPESAAPEPSAPEPEAPEPQPTPPPQPPLAAAATIAMSAEQLRAARGEIGETRSFDAAGSELAGFDFDEPESTSEVQPPPDFVPGSGRAWKSDAAPSSAPEPSAPVPSAPVPSAPEPPPVLDTVPEPAPPPPPDLDVALEPSVAEPSAPEPSAPVPAAPVPSAPEPAAAVPSAPEPSAPEPPELPPRDSAPQLVPPSYPDSKPIMPPEPRAPEPSSGPSFDRPVASWAEKPPGDGDATFAGTEYDSRTGATAADDDAWEPPDIAEDAASFESSWVPSTEPESSRTASGPAARPAPPGREAPRPEPRSSQPSFDRPTAPAAPPSSSEPGAFDRPTPPAAPPPGEMPREERVAGGAGGLLPTLDELDGAIAGPEMEMPYQPDPDPTAPVPIVSRRSVDAGSGFVLRAVATLLDAMWIFALVYASLLVTDFNQLVGLVVGIACNVGIVFGWALWGTTPGKMALGLRVEGKRHDPEGGGIGFLRAVIRAAGYLVSALPLGAGFLMIAFSKEKRGLHDRIAGTWVRRHG